MNYETLRQFSDSWGLLYLVLIFLGVIAYTFRPGSKDIADKIARIPLDDEDQNV